MLWRSSPAKVKESRLGLLYRYGRTALLSYVQNVLSERLLPSRICLKGLRTPVAS